MPEITIKNLKVSYGKKILALDNLDAVFESGKFNVIVGYSGSGKTTLLKAIANLVSYEGNVLFDGIDIEELSLSERNIAYVPQNYILIPNKTIFDNIAFPLVNSGAETDEIIRRVYAIAQDLSITCCLTRKPKHISAGQQQRASLARALVKHPAVCLMDEPLANLDVMQRTSARKLIKKTLMAYGTATVYVTHDLSEAMALADVLFVMDSGKIVISGKPFDVYNSKNAVVDSLIEKEVLKC